jgi:hypothetical protein
LFNASAEEANKDGIVSDCTNLGAMAQQYYKKPTSMGGGANTFTNWTIPTGLTATANGTYSASVSASSVVITGSPLESSYGWDVYTTVDALTITTIISP